MLNILGTQDSLLEGEKFLFLCQVGRLSINDSSRYVRKPKLWNGEHI